jgi:hypothetical protein
MNQPRIQTTHEVSVTAVAAVLAADPQLIYDGYKNLSTPPRTDQKELLSTGCLRQIAICLDYIQTKLQEGTPVVRKHHATLNILKHDVERWVVEQAMAREYISRGAMAVALQLSGYTTRGGTARRRPSTC